MCTNRWEGWVLSTGAVRWVTGVLGDCEQILLYISVFLMELRKWSLRLWMRWSRKLAKRVGEWYTSLHRKPESQIYIIHLNFHFTTLYPYSRSSLHQWDSKSQRQGKFPVLSSFHRSFYSYLADIQKIFMTVKWNHISGLILCFQLYTFSLLIFMPL